MKKNVPIAIALTVGLILIASYYVPALETPYNLILTWSPVIFGFAFFLGILSYAMHHWRKVRRKAENYGYSIASLIAFSTMILAWLLPEVSSGVAGLIGTVDDETNKSLFNWMFLNMLVPMEATMFALLAFYISSAAFRAFRARNLEATLLLTAAVLVMVGRVPLGEEIWGGFTGVQQWIMDFPNTAAKRAILMGVGLGMASTALKLMLGIERAYLGRS